MKSKKLMTKVSMLMLLSFVFVACGKKGTEPRGPGKGDLQTMIEAYEKENALLSADLRAKSKEIDLLQNELLRYKQESGVSDETIRELSEMLGRNKGGITVRDGWLVLDSDVTFGSGKDSLTTQGQSMLKDLIKAMRGKTVFVVGHTDSDPIVKSKHSSNWELSAKRATRVIEYLVQQGVDPAKVTGGFNAEFQPLPGAPKNKQRRIEIKILK